MAIEKEKTPSSKPATTSSPMFLRWAAILIVGLIGAAGWLKFFDAQRVLDGRNSEMARLNLQLDEVTRQLQEAGRFHDFMVVANQFVPLEATEPGTAVPVARVAYDASTSRVIAVFADALPPEGRDYQLWALGAEGVQSLGVIRADEAGRAVIEAEIVETASRLQGFAISLEPEGGSPDPNAPSGPVISVGLRG